MTSYTATYSPDDNKLRLYASSRLDAETYARVKAAGFKWAPKQDLFVAPMWTPGREDLLTELAGEVGDEDTSLTERAEERADRFEDYSDKRGKDAESARATVARIADGIPLGQPILVGHHSEKHARKDAERIENGMRRAVKMWETAGYWQRRAKGAVRAAKYKERPDVRARRIKTIETDKRRNEKNTREANLFLRMWRSLGDDAKWTRKDGEIPSVHERALHIANADYCSKRYTLAEFPRDPPASQYEGWLSLWSALKDGIIVAHQAQEIAIRVHETANEDRARWLAHYENRLAYERAMLDDAGGIPATQTPTGPEKGGACQCWAGPRGGWAYIHKRNQVSVTVLDNWGNGGGNFTRTIPFDKLHAVMSAAEVQAARDGGQLYETPDKCGFFLHDAPPPETAREPEPAAPNAADFAAMRETLKAGVTVAVVPQLFPTPPGIAAQMVEAMGLQPGQRILEPSAGTGNLLRAIHEKRERWGSGEPPCHILAIEINASLARAIPGAWCHDAIAEDFLHFDAPAGDPASLFDRVLMNPPFKNGEDIKHIEHARRFLKPGGRLVALCANGPRQQEKLRPLASRWVDLPAGSFSDAGTQVNVALFVIDVPAEVVREPARDLFALMEG